MGAEAGAEFADDAGGVFNEEADVETGDDVGIGNNVEGMGVKAAEERIEGLDSGIGCDRQ